MSPRSDLSGYLVADLTLGTTGALAADHLARMGTRVVRLVDAGARAALSEGPRVVRVDIGSEAGRRVCLDLIAASALVIEDRGPVWLREKGLSWAGLQAANPYLVLLSIDPQTVRAEAVLQAASGLMPAARFGLGSTKPVPLHFPAFAIAAGLHAACLGLAALVERASGRNEGRQIHIDPRTAVTDLAAIDDPRGHDTLVLGTADGAIAVVVADDEAFAALCALLGIEGMLADFRYATVDARRLNHDSLVETLEQRTMAESASRWRDRFDAMGIPAGSVADALKPQASALGDEDHTAEVLEEIGYRRDRLAALEREGVILPTVPIDVPPA